LGSALAITDSAEEGAMQAEGWYVDPFGSHEARWFSDGAPTALVRDGGEESYEAPPSTTYEGTLTPVDEDVDGNADDLLRSDSAEKPFDPHDGVRAVLDVFDQRPPH
jgi:hypothetical protein